MPAKQYDMQALAPYLPKPARVPDDAPRFLEALVYVPAFVGIMLLALGLLDKLSETSLGLVLGVAGVFLGTDMLVRAARGFGWLFPVVLTIPQGPEIIEKVEYRFIQVSDSTRVPNDDLEHFLRLSWATQSFGRDPWRDMKRNFPMPSGTPMTDSYHAQIIEALVTAGIGTSRPRVGFTPKPGLELEDALARLS